MLLAPGSLMLSLGESILQLKGAVQGHLVKCSLYTEGSIDHKMSKGDCQTVVINEQR